MGILTNIKVNYDVPVSVTRIGNDIKNILGIRKYMSGQAMNGLFCGLGIQGIIDAKEYKYKPFVKYEWLAEKTALHQRAGEPELNYENYFQWKPELIFGLLGIDQEDTFENNLNRVFERVEMLKLARVDELHIKTVAKEIANFLGLRLTKKLKLRAIQIWVSYIAEDRKPIQIHFVLSEQAIMNNRPEIVKTIIDDTLPTDEETTDIDDAWGVEVEDFDPNWNDMAM